MPTGSHGLLRCLLLWCTRGALWSVPRPGGGGLSSCRRPQGASPCWGSSNGSYTEFCWAPGGPFRSHPSRTQFASEDEVWKLLARSRQAWLGVEAIGWLWRLLRCRWRHRDDVSPAGVDKSSEDVGTRPSAQPVGCTRAADLAPASVSPLLLVQVGRLQSCLRGPCTHCVGAPGAIGAGI